MTFLLLSRCFNFDKNSKPESLTDHEPGENLPANNIKGSFVEKKDYPLIWTQESKMKSQNMYPFMIHYRYDLHI